MKFKASPMHEVFDFTMLPDFPFLVNKQSGVFIGSVIGIHFLLYGCVMNLCHAVQAQLFHLFNSGMIVHEYVGLVNLLVLISSSDILMRWNMVPGFQGEIKLIHPILEHIFNRSVRTSLSTKHLLTCFFNATLVIQAGQVNNTLCLLITNLRITILKNEFGDVLDGLGTYVLSFLLEKGEAPLSISPVST